MSNINGFRNLNNNNGNRAPLLGNRQRRVNIPFAFVTGVSTQGNPRAESFLEMLKNNFFPQVELKSFIVIITLVSVAIFVIEMLVDGINIPGEFLEIPETTLSVMGAKEALEIRYEFEIWRVVTCLLLHADFQHLLFNSINQLFFLLPIEAQVGWKKMAQIYFITGAIGSTFSCILSNELTVGNTTALFGVLASQIGFLLINWHAFNPNDNTRSMYMCIITLLILLCFFFQGSSRYNDLFGGLGAVIAGILLGLVIYERPQCDNDFEQKAQQIGLYGVVAFGVLCAVLLFLL